MPRAKPQPARARDSSVTREALLQAARGLFGQNSYDRVGVREIAENAGVNPALVIRYFGSKEQLFAEVVAEHFDITPLLTQNRTHFGEQIARYVLTGKDDHQRLNSVTALLISIPNEHAQTHLRQQLQNHFIQPLADWLGGQHAALRASLIASELLGLVMLRDVARVSPLSDGDLEALIQLTARSIQSKVRQK
jgi:AcrR family transcriptional regulator